MGFWNKVKKFFGAGSEETAEEDASEAGDTAPLFDDSGLPTQQLLARVEHRIRKRAAKQHLFTRDDIARKVLKGVDRLPNNARTLAANQVLKLKKAGLFEQLGYECSYALVAKTEVFHPAGTSAERYPGAGGGVAAAPPAQSRPNSPAQAPPAQAPVVQSGSPYRQPGGNPYAPGPALGLSAFELRQRALKINPYQTAWIGRVGTIPPAEDERTALIDRGLVLRGYFTEQQIAEFHRIGDAWLEQRDRGALVATRAKARAQQDLLEAREAKLQAKAAKKAAAAERRLARAADIQRRRDEDIVFLGRGVSGKLGDRRSNVEALQAASLPVLTTPADVAQAMGLSIKTLRWLAFHSEAAEKIHYRQFEVPKKTGGTRLLSAPLDQIDAAQRWILERVLGKLEPSEDAHGFVRGRSTVTNAAPHVRSETVVNVDLKDFFPSIHFPRVRGLFQSLGYSPASATIFALLTTEAPRRRVLYDGKPYWVACGPRGLPQGACTSPALANMAARTLDKRLAAMSAKHGLRYTRYADDLTLSSPSGARCEIGMLLARIRHIAQEEGFTVHPDKIHVQRAAGRQCVTGVVVNRQLAVPREELRRLRAILHAAKTTGLDAQNRDNHPDFRAHLQGKIAYVHMIDPARGDQLLRQLGSIP